jgi:hypothetical protein
VRLPEFPFRANARNEGYLYSQGKHLATRHKEKQETAKHWEIIARAHRSNEDLNESLKQSFANRSKLKLIA